MILERPTTSRTTTMPSDARLCAVIQPVQEGPGA